MQSFRDFLRLIAKRISSTSPENSSSVSTVSRPACEWCGHEHAGDALCTSRPKWKPNPFVQEMRIPVTEVMHADGRRKTISYGPATITDLAIAYRDQESMT